MLHHYRQELDHNLRRRPDDNLAFAALLGVVDRLKRIIEHTNQHVGLKVL